MDDNNELIIYVLQQLRQGVPEAAIRNVLAQNGWPQPLIDRAFSMVQQARPHEVTPPPGVSLPQTLPGENALPAPSENPYPVIEDEKKLERRSNRRRRALIATLIILLLAGIGAAIFLFMQRTEPTPKKETPKAAAPAETQNPDTQRKERLDGLSAELIHYYDEKGTYPTLAQINGADFATSKSGFDITKYRDPSWDAKKSPCVDDKGRPIFVGSHAESCFTYRATAANGEDCDGNAKKCTRVVVTSTLQDKTPHIVAIDQNKKE